MKLGMGDGLSEYVQHTGSALFAIPPGIAQGEYLGQAMLA
jgi:deferrochelatase/peroxidase EfeB